MNKKKFLQTESGWGGLGYPKKPWYIRNCGCGEVSIANCIIEIDKYADYTPATIQPYCKQFAAPNGDGTYFSGIPKMMKHYGMTEVKEHATMSQLWHELEKGGRVAIYLMGKRPGGSKKVHWTSGGHIVCSVDYKYEKGKHMVYVKDSYSNSTLRNKWISYEENMKNDVIRVWSGKLKVTETSKADASATATVKAPQSKMLAYAKKLAASDYHYVYYNKGKKAHECPICHDHPKGEYYGGNCIWLPFACWHHGAGLKCKCKCDVFTDQIYEKMLKVSMHEAFEIAQDRVGLKTIKLIRNKNGSIDPKKLEPGDVVVYFNRNDKYCHTAMWVGDGKIADCTSAREDSIKYGVPSYTKWEIKLAIRYTGK